MEDSYNPQGKILKESNIKNNNEKIKDTQFYLITLEDSNGEHQQIRIFKNSDAAEIAFNFCKENNLDYKSMKYIKKNIQKIIEKFDEPNHKLFFLDNSYSSIQEVDEENLVSENTLLDNEAIKEKNSNKKIIKEIKFKDNNDKEGKIINNKNKEENKEDNNIIEIKNNEMNKDNKDIDLKNENLSFKRNNIELINKNDNIKNNKNNIKENNICHKEKNDLIKLKKIDEMKIQNINLNEKLKEKQQGQNIYEYLQNNNKLNNYNKIDLNSIKRKMNEMKFKNSVINNKKEKKNENIDIKSKFNKIRNNNTNNSNLKNQLLLTNKSNNIKKNEIGNENIIEKYLKALKNKQNSKTKNLITKKEEKTIDNKTFIENSNNISLKNTKKEKLLQKTRKNKNVLLLQNTDILNNEKMKAKIKKENDIIKTEENKYLKSNAHSTVQSTRLTPRKSNIYRHSKENSNPAIKFKPKKEKIIKLRNILQSNKEIFANLLSNIFTQNNNKTNINKNMRTCYNEIQDKNQNIKNKIIRDNNRNKNYYNTDRDENEKYSFDLIKGISQSKKKIKRKTETRNGLNIIFNNLIEQRKNNIMNTNYIINKRCRIINNRRKKNMSMNLSGYISNNKKYNKSKKNSLEINISNNNFNNTYDKVNEKEKVNKIKRPLTNKNSDIFSNNKRNLLNLINSKKIKNKIIQNNFTMNNLNTNIRNYRLLNTINSYKTRKKIIEMRNKTKNNSSKKQLGKNKDICDISNSYSLLINTEKPQTNDDYSLNVLDQYYTINNTINITNNNNSMMNDFLNNGKLNKEDKVINLAKRIYIYLDKENIGFIILNSKQKIKQILIKNKLLLTKEQEKIIEKIFLYLFEIHKRNNNYELDEDKIIINERSFIKTMKYIFNKNLNFNERNIFLSIEKNFNFNNKKKIWKK